MPCTCAFCTAVNEKPELWKKLLEMCEGSGIMPSDLSIEEMVPTDHEAVETVLAASLFDVTVSDLQAILSEIQSAVGVTIEITISSTGMTFNLRGPQ